MIIRIVSVTIFNFLLTVTLGFGSLKNEYPRREHYERLYGIYMTQILPISLIGSMAGLFVAEKLVRKQSESAQLRRLAARKLENPSLTSDEVTAWTTIAATLPEDDA
ncbi:hypothetical protein NDI45_12750 [Leptolyngbya sp. GB1-A1]|uniref:hypothetical protein n=1 Tax=Leptolyngbya sp. GB1-A1 TaxID=2933908 RepID=UPI0032993624